MRVVLLIIPSIIANVKQRVTSYKLMRFGIVVPFNTYFKSYFLRYKEQRPQI